MALQLCPADWPGDSAVVAFALPAVTFAARDAAEGSVISVRLVEIDGVVEQAFSCVVENGYARLEESWAIPAGSTYVLRAVCPGIRAVESRPFTATPGRAVQLRPRYEGWSTLGLAAIEVIDAAGNVVDAQNTRISCGTISRPVIAGSAVFSADEIGHGDLLFNARGMCPLRTRLPDEAPGTVRILRAPALDDTEQRDEFLKRLPPELIASISFDQLTHARRELSRSYDAALSDGDEPPDRSHVDREAKNALDSLTAVMTSTIYPAYARLKLRLSYLCTLQLTIAMIPRSSLADIDAAWHSESNRRILQAALDVFNRATSVADIGLSRYLYPLSLDPRLRATPGKWIAGPFSSEQRQQRLLVCDPYCLVLFVDFIRTRHPRSHVVRNDFLREHQSALPADESPAVVLCILGGGLSRCLLSLELRDVARVHALRTSIARCLHADSSGCEAPFDDFDTPSNRSVFFLQSDQDLSELSHRQQNLSRTPHQALWARYFAQKACVY